MNKEMFKSLLSFISDLESNNIAESVNALNKHVDALNDLNATFQRSLYAALINKGFTEKEALSILISENKNN